MNLIKIWVVIAAASAMLMPLLLEAEEYRIDSQRAFDAINKVTLAPGDTVLLKHGMSFIGMLAPQGNGEENAAIRISTYGTGPRPKILAQGKSIAGLMLSDPSYWEVDGLEITNTDGTDVDQGERFGVYVLAQGEEKVYRHVHIDNCYIHDVNGKVAGKHRGGIHVHIKKLKKSIFDDLRVTRNRIVNVGGVGIGNQSSSSRIEFFKTKTKTEYLWTNVYVAGNYLDHTGRNCIIARCSKDAVYEYNILANSSRYDTGHSIFCFKTDGIKIQYNEAYGNIGKEEKDRGGFDADFKCVNTFIQYNYSHDNMWFCGIMKKPNRNVVIRYNISQNERRGIYFYGFEPKKSLDNLHIYNNTHYTKKGLKVSVFPEGRTPINTLFENNIFYFEGKASWGKRASKAVNTTFNNNLYYGIDPHPTDEKAITANPNFSSPGKSGSNIDLETMKDLLGYCLNQQSPCLDQGVSIQGNGGIDFLKNKIRKGRAHIGAFAAGPLSP